MFGASVTCAKRNENDTKWRLEMELNGEPHAEEFDKVVFCHGYQTKPKMPTYESQELYEGQLIHSQKFRR